MIIIPFSIHSTLWLSSIVDDARHPRAYTAISTEDGVACRQLIRFSQTPSRFLRSQKCAQGNKNVQDNSVGGYPKTPVAPTPVAPVSNR